MRIAEWRAPTGRFRPKGSLFAAMPYSKRYVLLQTARFGLDVKLFAHCGMARPPARHAPGLSHPLVHPRGSHRSHLTLPARRPGLPTRRRPGQPLKLRSFSPNCEHGPYFNDTFSAHKIYPIELSARFSLATILSQTRVLIASLPSQIGYSLGGASLKHI